MDPEAKSLIEGLLDSTWHGGCFCMALDSGLEKDSLVAAEGLTCLRLDISKDFWSLSLPLSLSQLRGVH